MTKYFENYKILRCQSCQRESLLAPQDFDFRCACGESVWREFDNTPYAFGFTVYNINNSQINRASVRKMQEAKARRDKISEHLPGSNSQDFQGCREFHIFVNSRDDCDIEVERQDHPWTANRYGPQGIKSALFFIKLSRKRDLPVADGMPNLYSEQIMVDTSSDSHTLRVYAATWVISASKKLYDQYEVRNGFIASYKNIFYHTTTSPDHARQKVVAKYHKVQREQADLMEIRRRHRLEQRANNTNSAQRNPPIYTGKRIEDSWKELEEYVEKSRYIKELKVSFKDSTSAGNCAEGTRAFVKQHGLDRKKKYKLIDIMKLDPGNAKDLNLQRTLLHVVKRNKKAREELERFLQAQKISTPIHQSFVVPEKSVAGRVIDNMLGIFQ